MRASPCGSLPWTPLLALALCRLRPRGRLRDADPDSRLRARVGARSGAALLAVPDQARYLHRTGVPRHGARDRSRGQPRPARRSPRATRARRVRCARLRRRLGPAPPGLLAQVGRRRIPERSPLPATVQRSCSAHCCRDRHGAKRVAALARLEPHGPGHRDRGRGGRLFALAFQASPPRCRRCATPGRWSRASRCPTRRVHAEAEPLLLCRCGRRGLGRDREQRRRRLGRSCRSAPADTHARRRLRCSARTRRPSRCRRREGRRSGPRQRHERGVAAKRYVLIANSAAQRALAGAKPRP